MKITGNVRLRPDTNEKLRAISAARKSMLLIVNKQQDIIAELVDKEYKRVGSPEILDKECKS